MSNKNILTAFVCVMIFLFMVTAYGTLQTELQTQANAVNASAIVIIFSATFPLWWWSIATMFLGLAVWYGSKA